MKFLIVTCILFTEYLAFASDPLVMPIGHDLDMTGSTLKSGHCTVGIQFAGCGLSDQFTLGTSPWLLTDYNSYNLFGRYSLNETSIHRQAFQMAYIKSYFLPEDPRNHIYKMELIWIHFIHSAFVAPHYTAHFNVSGMYFWNETAPFSLRRPSFYKDPYQLNFGVLNEINLTGGLYLNAEVAILDAVKKYFHLHLGMSLEYRTEHWLTHFGLSQSQTFNSFQSAYKRDNQEVFSGYGLIDEELVKSDYSIHPEITIQYYF